MNQTYDVVIVGGGAAGLSAALTLSRARRSVLVADAGEPRNAPAEHVHNYLGREGTAPAELLSIGRDEVSRYGGDFVTAVVKSAHRIEDGESGFEVVLDDQRSVRSRRLLVTTGLVDELPDVPGLAERWGRDVLHCPYCHGWEFRDHAIGVLASGPFAAHQALMFRQWTAELTLFLHTAPEPSDDEIEKLTARGVKLVQGEVVGIEVTGDRMSGVRLLSGEVVPVQAITVQSRFVARDDVLASLGLKPSVREMNGHVVSSSIAADANGATEVPGVWVAGNVTDARSQVVTAAAAGVNVAGMINGDLTDEDARRAVTASRAAA